MRTFTPIFHHKAESNSIASPSKSVQYGLQNEQAKSVSLISRETKQLFPWKDKRLLFNVINILKIMVSFLLSVNAASLIFSTESHKLSVLKAPTKEEVSLRAYTARVKLNKLRRSACRLYTDDVMIKAIKRLEIEIETRRLLVRKDRHLWKDIGENGMVFDFVTCVQKNGIGMLYLYPLKWMGQHPSLCFTAT